MNISELSKFRGGVSVDTINELTSASGVTADGVLLKDAAVTATGGVTAPTISEAVSGSGVSVDGVLLKDSNVNASGVTAETVTATGNMVTDTILERTSAAGVTIDGVLLKDGGITATGTNTINLTTITADTINETTSGSGVTVAGVLFKDGKTSSNNIDWQESTMFRNRIKNGSTAIDQRNAGASQTFTAAAALAYSIDRFYGYCTGANVTGQRVAGTLSQYMYQFTGAASVTKIGFAQRIEAIDCLDLAGTNATLAVDLSNSLLTTVTWTAWYANTADTFGTLASPTRTQIATGTFTVTSTNARYSTTIAIPAAATTGIEIEFSVAAQTSGTFKIGRVQLEPGSVATPFEFRPYGTELALCQRYYWSFTNLTCATTSGGFSGNAYVLVKTPVDMRATAVSITDATLYAAGTGVASTSTAGIAHSGGFIREYVSNPAWGTTANGALLTLNGSCNCEL
jgi:hypothetical protein